MTTVKPILDDAIAYSLNKLAGLYQDQGHLDKAEPLYEEALAIRRAALPPGHPGIAASLQNLGLLYQAKGFDTPN